jgi:hypothetical protein
MTSAKDPFAGVCLRSNSTYKQRSRACIHERMRECLRAYRGTHTHTHTHTQHEDDAHMQGNRAHLTNNRVYLRTQGHSFKLGKKVEAWKN